MIRFTAPTTAVVRNRHTPDCGPSCPAAALRTDPARLRMQAAVIPSLRPILIREGRTTLSHVVTIETEVRLPATLVDPIPYRNGRLSPFRGPRREYRSPARLVLRT